MKLKNLNLLFLLTFSLQAFSAQLELPKTKAERKALEKKLSAEHNAEFVKKVALGEIKFDKETLFAFDLHDVIAKYDIPKMVLKSSFIATSIGTTLYFANQYLQQNAFISAYKMAFVYFILYSLKNLSTFKTIYSSLKEGRGTGAQEIHEAVCKNNNSWWNPIDFIWRKMFEQGIWIADTLKPMQGTIEIITQLKQKGYKVCILSNIEPKLLDGFKNKFPDFKDVPAFIITPGDDWIKKPNPEFYKKFVMWAEFGECRTKKENIIFFDDRWKNVKAAQECGIKSYVFSDATDLYNLFPYKQFELMAPAIFTKWQHKELE